jgi:uncharacterized protein YfdQ (DUF2303 family)
MAPPNNTYTGERSSSPTITRTETDALVEAVGRLHQAEVHDLDVEGVGKIPYAIVPDGQKVQSFKEIIDKHRQRPERRQGTAALGSIDSFVDHVNRFKDKHSAIFADVQPAAATLIGVLDYHEGGDKGGARFGTHRATYQFPLSDEWKAWTTAAKEPMSQTDFAYFIEDHLPEVAMPEDLAKMPETLKRVSAMGMNLATPQRLLELSRSLKIRVGQVFKGAQNLSTGEAQMSFEERHDDPETGAPVTIPNGFVVSIPVFRMGAPYMLAVRLRYRAAGQGQVTWIIAPYRLDRAWEDAVKLACSSVGEKTALPLFYGRPEQ